MSGGLFLTLLALAGVAGFGSGFIGLGGGLLLFPLLLYLPPYLGLEAIDAKTVAALVISQVFFGGLIGGAAHWRQGRVHEKAHPGRRGYILSRAHFLPASRRNAVPNGFCFFLFGIVTLIAGP